MMTSAVMVQMTTVSMNGSSRLTKPSVHGSSVCTAEWAMAAEPRPASFENTARRNPMIMTPIIPPPTLSGEKAPCQIWTMAAGSRSALMPMIASAEST